MRQIGSKTSCAIVVDELDAANFLNGIWMALFNFLRHETDMWRVIAFVSEFVNALSVVELSDFFDVVFDAYIRAEQPFEQSATKRTTAEPEQPSSEAEQIGRSCEIAKCRIRVGVSDRRIGAVVHIPNVLAAGILLIAEPAVEAADALRCRVRLIEIRHQRIHVIVVCRSGQALIVLTECGRLIATTGATSRSILRLDRVIALLKLELITGCRL